MGVIGGLARSKEEKVWNLGRTLGGHGLEDN